MYSNAQHTKDAAGNNNTIRVDINGATSWVPLDLANTDYVAIMALVESGELVIAPAE
jgi:hypothetical protein